MKPEPEVMRRSFKNHLHNFVVSLQVVSLLIMPANSAIADGLTGGVVVDGAATISAATNTTTITQSTQNAIINWDAFSVGAGQTANFVQPNASASVLNHVTGGSLSSIAGQINANGQVIIANPNGVVFTNGSLVNVGALTATTLNVDNSAFMNGGALRFSGDSNASIINNGSVTASNDDINFFAADVQNNGTLMAPNGLINLGAGHDITLHENGTYTVNGANGSVQVLNTGIIDGGRTMLTAGAGTTAVNAGVEKASMIVRQNGRVYLGTPSSTIEMVGGSRISANSGAQSNVNLNGASAEVVDTSINAANGSVVIDSTVATTVVDTNIAANNAQILSDGTATGLNVTATGDLRLDPVNVTAGGITAGSIVIDTATAGAGTSLGPGLGNITITGNLEATAPGGDISLLANNDILTAADLITNGGDVIITGDADLSGIGGDPFDGVGAVFLDSTRIFTEGGNVQISGIGHNSQGAAGLLSSGVGVTFSRANIDTRVGASTGSPVNPGAGDIMITGTGNRQSRGGVSDTGGNIGVLVTDGSSLSGRQIDINGEGGGLPVADLIATVVASPDAASAISTVNGIIGNENKGVQISISEIKTTTGDLNIRGIGGIGVDRNDGINIDSSTISSMAGNINIVGTGGGVDAKIIQGRGPSWILENTDGTVNTLFEKGWDAAAVAAFPGLFGDDNNGVTINDAISTRHNEGGGGSGVTISSDYIEPANIRDTQNHFLTGTFNDAGDFTPDFLVPRDDLNENGTRIPEARHILIDGTAGMGTNDQTGVDIASSSHVEIRSESADIHIRGVGTGIVNGSYDPYIQGLTETTKDMTPFAGSDRVANTGIVSNSQLIAGIAAIYGDNNDGIQIEAKDAVNILANANLPSNGASRTVKQVGGNIFLNGLGGLGQGFNRGVEITTDDSINVVSDHGNIRIDGGGGGYSSFAFSFLATANDRVDRLFEVDFSDSDVAQFVADLYGTANDNDGVHFDSGTSTNIVSSFKEPPALRQYADGTYGYGYFNPDAPTDRGVLVMTEGNRFRFGTVIPDDAYLIVDANGMLIPVDNRPPFALNDNGEIGADLLPGGQAVVQDRIVAITGIGGEATSENHGIEVLTGTNFNVTTQAADISITGFSTGASSVLIGDLIENAADTNPAAGSDRIDDATLLSDSVASSVIIDALRDLYGDNNSGISIKTTGDANIRTTLTPETIWATDVLQPLGPDGSEIVDLTMFGLGAMRLDMLPSVDVSGLSAADQEAVRAEIAKVSDNLIVTATRRRANIRVNAIGGAGDTENHALQVVTGGAINIEALNTADSLQDGGDITFEAFGTGIVNTSVTNGVTDSLFDVDLDAVDIARLATEVYGDNNDGIHFDSGDAITIASAFVEPFVPAAPIDGGWGGSAHRTNGDRVIAAGNLVASRDVQMIGRAGAGIHNNDGTQMLSSDSINIKTASANLYFEGVGGDIGVRAGQALITNASDAIAGDKGDRVSDGMAVANSSIIDAISDLYGDDNSGIEIQAANSVTIESMDSRVSAPNSNVGRMIVFAAGGNGSSDNVGLDIQAGPAIDVYSGVGNVEIYGIGGGFPTSVVTDSSPTIDSINELPSLLATELNQLRSGFSTGDIYGDGNHGIHTQSAATTIESGYTEPVISDPSLFASHAYSYRNGANKANPFFLDYEIVVKGSPVVDDSEGFVRVERNQLFFSGLEGNGSNGKVEGREVAILGLAGNGQNNNKGILLEGGISQILSVDADIDIDGLGGGIPDEVIDSLHTTHPGFGMPIANLYGTDNHGVEIVGRGSGAQSSGKGSIEVNGTGGTGYANNKGILINAGNVWSAEEGDIIMVGTGGGILETFNVEYDFVGGMGVRENNHGIHISGASRIESSFDAQTSTDPYEMKMEALLVLDGQVGNNAGLGNNEVGEIRDITSIFYEHDLGGPITDDAGILIESGSIVRTADADIDLFANLDLLIRGESFVGTSQDGDIAAVATRHLEVSGASLLNSSGSKEDNTPTLTTVAWDQSGLEGDLFGDTLGRLKVSAGSGIGASMGQGQLRLYGNRRGPDPQPFGTNSQTPHPTGFAPAAFNNEIDSGAVFNGVVWSDIERNNPGPNDPSLPAVNSGDHNLEFCPWEQEQWNTAFDFANRRAISDSDRFSSNQAPTTYQFGNPGDFTADLTFFYRGESLHTDLPVLGAQDCGILPFSCYLREHIGPMSYSEMMESVFGSNGSIGYGPGWAGATGGTVGTSNFTAFNGTPFSLTGPRGSTVSFRNVASLVEFLEEEPAGTYSLQGTGNSPDAANTVTYEHAPDDPEWQKKLEDALRPTSTPASPTLSIPPAASLDTDVTISGLTQ